MNHTIILLIIARTKGIGYQTMLKILKETNNIEQALNYVQTNYTIPDQSEIIQEYNQTIAYGANFIFANDPLFPKNINSTCLIYQGNLDLLKEKPIAIIGSRDCSIESDIICRKLLENQKITTISGLAQGIDYITHTNSYQTIAVLGTSIDQFYPKIHKKLQEKIGKIGLVLTEQPYGQQIQKFHFISRNKIIASLCKSLIVIEASKRSGTISTAKYAMSLGKDVYVVPGHPLNHKFTGNNSLLAIGANILYDSSMSLNTI